MSEQQRTLFDVGRREPSAPWEQDDAGSGVVAKVVLAEVIDEPLDYLVPDRLLREVEPGRRVIVPLGRGNRQITGYCVQVGGEAPAGRRLKNIHSVVDDRSLLSEHMLRVTRWIAERYFCTWGQVLQAVLPAGVRSKAGTRLVTLLQPAEGALEKIEQKKLPPKQAAVILYLLAAAEPQTMTGIAEAVGCTTAPIASLRRKGLIRSTVQRLRFDAPEEIETPPDAPHILNAEQQTALDSIHQALESRQHSTVVLHGVTGSGKTEVYMRAIAEVVGYGRQAIVLVPEISLTPQTEARFRARFDQVAVLHSHQTDAERHWHWERIAAGQVSVVVGPRSAIFAPTPHLGLVIIDEEHESTFKQDSAPRYHARRVAAYRAELENVPLVLGSATPSLETWYRATQGEYELVELPNRVLDRPLPKVGTIDLRMEFRNRTSRGAVSRQLHTAIDTALKEGGQVILLLNRRGFSTHIQCPSCGEAVLCPHCDIALTHHRAHEQAICHYCEYTQPTPTACPHCDFAGIRHSGVGTQKLEAEIRARFSQYTCLRMDTDSMQKRGSHAEALEKFRRGEVQILLGTQMIAKGLDFPNVTLVGVINADTALHLPDFRAAERTFQLITQVAGRTGRGERGGRVLVQTYEPDHPAIRAAMEHDLAAFAAHELPIRQKRGYPPFAEMVRIVARGDSSALTRAFCEHLAESLKKEVDLVQADVKVLGPAPAAFPKLRGQHRYCLQLQAVDGERLRALVRAAITDARAPEAVHWAVDVDPMDMM